ncbi:extracellular solute-binding protein [Paenibacillus hodogayensis]|uniref:Extracellular solute-binding protein n=1 Tax=Paenibacillus hodogayensis TaxID=279208 RepID=A0ABV5VT09_9BACL
MRKRNISAALAATTVLTVLTATGCSSAGTAKQASPSANTARDTTGVPADPVKLEIAQVSYGTNPPADDFLRKELERKLNVLLKMTLVADAKEYESQINVRAASGTIPDLTMLVNKKQMQQLADAGALLDLTPYVDKLPEYKKFAGADVIKKGTYSGKQYAIAKAGQSAQGTYWIRKDWLDNLKLAMPTTIEELLTVAKAFTENDPAGTGKKDTFGITGPRGFIAFDAILGAYGVTLGYDDHQFFLKGDKVVNTFYEPAFKEAMRMIKTFIDAGVVDPELMSNKGSMATDKAFQGKAGIISTNWSNIAKDEFVKVWKEANPKAEWVQLPPPQGPNGVQNSSPRSIGSASGLWVIPKRLESQPDKLNKALELLDYVSSQEGNLLVQFGLKDTHFKLEGNKAVITEKGRKEAGYTFLYQLTGRPEIEYLKTKFDKQAGYVDFEAKLPRINTLDAFVDKPQGYNAADAARFIEEEMIKFAYGKSKLADYDKFLKTLEGTFQYKIYIDSAMKQLKELGYGK